MTEWFENGDGLLVLNVRERAEDSNDGAEDRHVRFCRISLTDSGHYILPLDDIKDDKLTRAGKCKAVSFFQKVAFESSQTWSDVKPWIRHCFMTQAATGGDRCEHECDKDPHKDSEDHHGKAGEHHEVLHAEVLHQGESRGVKISRLRM